MPHKYDNFLDVWDDLWPEWNSCRDYYDGSVGELAASRAQWNIPNDHLAIHYLINSVQRLQWICKGMFDFWENYYYNSHYMEAFYWAYKDAPSAEVTMDTILSTMLSATPDQVEYFVGLVDAYRSSIWQRPFNQEFFAALARGFKEWP